MTSTRDVVLGHWSLVVLRDKIVVLGPGLGLGTPSRDAWFPFSAVFRGHAGPSQTACTDVM